MNDRNQDPAEDRAIELAWSQVAAGGEPALELAGEPADAALVREYTELLGLLPYELAAEAPPVRIKEQVLARAAGVPAARETSTRKAADRAPVVPFESPAPRPAWAFAQAAVLAASLVGLGFLSAMVWQQSRQIGQLQGQLATSFYDRGESAQMEEELHRVRSRLDMITNVARHAYPLRTVSSSDGPRQPEGIVYVCGLHQQWYLSLRDLEPPPDGGEYHLWFMTDEGKVDGGLLEVGPGATTEMEALTLPAGTRGFLVTLEKPDEPESLTILLGDDVINL